MSEFPRLSNREWDVLNLLLQGKSNKLIASSLSISNRTVEFHLKNIYAKFQVSSRIELILKLGNTTGKLELQKLGHSTVASTGKIAENKDRLNLWMSWAKSFIGKEIDMKNLLISKHVLVGVMTTLFTGAMWVSALLYSQLLFPSEIKAWVASLIIVWVIIGLTIGLVGKRYGTTLQRVFFSTLFGAGLSPFTIIPLMMFLVLPIGRLAEWLGMIDPATMPTDVATNLTMIAMTTIWLFVGIFIGIMLLFLTFKKPEQASAQQAQVLEQRL
ncbi:MAG: response regulator transcription factor [Chloroflexota bacterium]|nr:helix-turn-helix transcriptional regulator [Chloroflexota bacterium]MBI5703398.1 helix-turn-helix transcriptional regulator [Chloroflexota bacterium]